MSFLPSRRVSIEAVFYREIDTEMTMRAAIIGSVALVTALLWLCSSAVAQQLQQSSRLKTIEQCNGRDRIPAQARIVGCTALINSGDAKPSALALAYNNRGNAYTATAEYDRAISDFGRAIEIASDYVKPLNNRGVAHLRMGAYDEAIKDFGGAIRLDPGYGSAFANRAGAHLKLDQYDRALLDFNEAIRLDPNSRLARSGRCWARAVVGDLQAGLEDCDSAIQLGAHDAATYDSRALIHLKMGQFAAAIDDYNSALRLTPNLATALYGRGLAKLGQGDKAGNRDVSAAKLIELRIGDAFVRYGVR
ncbi:tetratricopeptide repeat protein [Bradyrhizobium sp. CCGE-LA001]|uniref:tetratricopeptide repeat protein n=1 Tax=Bradyrhizobium sp. CCGE-LA001 TaxID=1223566 RepID=UPI001F2A3408|nr:tetratricopeptide repeat protein [Bradyrhizobium sp. CCGE-LA001]